MGEVRRHGAELDAAIQSAVLDLLADAGPAAITMEAVAAAAKTSKPVLYRRWPDSRALLRDVLLCTLVAAAPSGDTGSYRTDMLAVFDGLLAVFTGPLAPAMRAVVTAMQHDAELAQAFRADVIGWRHTEMDELLARGIRRGDVRADVSFEIARELAQSVLWHRWLITGEPIPEELVTELVDEVLVRYVAPRQ